MPKRRKRYDDNDQPEPCTVTIPGNLAAYLYRERRTRKYRDETELVAAIVREWSNALEEMNWEAVLKDLKAEEEAAAKANVKPRRGSGKRTRPDDAA